MQKTKNTNSKTIKILFLLIITGLVFFAEPAKADWGWGTPEVILQRSLDTIYETIQGALLGNLKMLAVQVLNSQIESLIGGVNGSGVLYITNWQEYLYKIPAQQNQLYVNDLLSQTTRGKCSGVNFQSASTGTFGSNYFTYLCNSALMASNSGPLFYATIDQYSTDPVRSLSEGDWRVFNALFSNPANNPLGYSLMIQQAQQRDYAARVEAAKAEGIANQGYNSVKVGDVVVTPGRTVGDLVQNVKTLGNDIIANSTNPSEFLGSVITSVANKAINQMMQQGFNVARTQIQRGLGKVNQQIYQTSQKVNKSLGPASQYLNGVNQSLGTINSANRSSSSPGTPAANAGCQANAINGC